MAVTSETDKLLAIASELLPLSVPPLSDRTKPREENPELSGVDPSFALAAVLINLTIAIVVEIAEWKDQVTTLTSDPEISEETKRALERCRTAATLIAGDEGVVGRAFVETGEGFLREFIALRTSVDWITGVANALNIGSAGTGVFKQKTALGILEFYKLNALSGLSIALDAANNKIDFDVVESQINHDLLLNFVLNEHIDHTLVSMVAGTGISGGGTIAANRTFDLAFQELSILAPGTGDYLAFLTGSNNHRRATIADILALSSAASVSYTPADPGDWRSDVDPGDVNDALDQLADRIENAPLLIASGGANPDWPNGLIPGEGYGLNIYVDAGVLWFEERLRTFTEEVIVATDYLIFDDASVVPSDGSPSGRKVLVSSFINSVIKEALALADLSDVTAKTGSGTVVVMQDAPTLRGPNGFDVLDFDDAGFSSANSFKLAAGGLGNPVEINALGLDTDISINVQPKGAGELQVNGAKVLTEDDEIAAASLAADASTRCFIHWLENPTVGDQFPVGFCPHTSTIQAVRVQTDSGTVDFNIEKRAFGSYFSAGTDIWASDEQATSTGVEITAFAMGEAGVGSEQALWVDISAVSGATLWFLEIEYTVN